MDVNDGSKNGGIEVPNISGKEGTGTETGSKNNNGSKTGAGTGSKQTSKSSNTAETSGAGSGTGTNTSKDKVPEVPGVPGIVEVKAGKNSGKKSSSSSAKELKELKDNISVLLIGSFGLAASKLGEHWNISAEEADKIADPTVKIMERLGASEIMGKYSDYISLFMAASLVVVPRIMITKSEIDARRGGIERVKKAAVTPNPQPAPAGSGSQVNSIIGSLKADLIDAIE